VAKRFRPRRSRPYFSRSFKSEEVFMDVSIMDISTIFKRQKEFLTSEGRREVRIPRGGTNRWIFVRITDSLN
jgi:hypothetical protein